MSEDWLSRWEEGRTGWHEPGGNEGLKAHWPDGGAARRVLVPLCGKSPDLIWLAKRGHDVTGVDMSELAVESFFAEHNLAFERDAGGPLTRFAASEIPVTLWCGDYFRFRAEKFDALYDRGALVALEQSVRIRYVEHTRQLLKPDSLRLIVTLEYDQSIVSGPPFSVSAGEISGYWDDLQRVEVKDDIDTCPPKFRKAGLTEINEVFWLSG